MPKVVAVIPIHRRVQMAIETVRMLRYQTVPVTTILIGDSEVEAQIAKEVGCEYIQYPNRPLSSKWQVGVWRAGDLNPDVVLILGSDTWLTPTWCETGLERMQEGYHVVGSADFYIMHLMENEIELIHRSYKGARANRPCGVGRMISRVGMEKLNWILFGERRGRQHCDGIAWRAIKVAGLGYTFLPKQERVLSISCDKWPCKHTFAYAKTSTGLRTLQGISSNINSWLASIFPGSLEAMDRLRKSTWPKDHS